MTSLKHNFIKLGIVLFSVLILLLLLSVGLATGV
jgi:hypothetical protein